MNNPDFKYKWAKFDGGSRLVNEVSSAAIRVNEALQKLDLASTGISEYNQRYLGTKIMNPIYENSIVVYMLSTLLGNADLPRKDITLLDYGAGSGLICLVAKALGIGTVIYSDIYDVSCSDAEIIGRAIGFRADHYVTGESANVAEYMKIHNLSCDMLVSHDCLEHIYDVEAFLDSIRNFPTSKMAIWLSSAANPLRPKTRRTLSAVAVKAEIEDKPEVWGHKDRDALKSFRSIRREMIREAAPGMDDSVIETLADKTRGMRQDDIVAAVRRYRSDGVMPLDPAHPTNTCDPYTGNWAEQLMDPFRLAEYSAGRGLQLGVKPGYWASQPNNRLKDLAKATSNAIMSYLGDSSLKLAPYYVLYGKYLPETGDKH